MFSRDLRLRRPGRTSASSLQLVPGAVPVVDLRHPRHADLAERQVEFASQTTSTWNLTLENTALLETNASIDAIGIYLDSDGTEMPWYLGMTLAVQNMDFEAYPVML